MSMIMRGVFAATLAMVALDSPTNAKTHTEDGQLPPVTVTGIKPPTAEEPAGNSIATFINTHAKVSVVTGLLGRWRAPICPQTIGMEPAVNAYVTARVRAVASLVRAPLNDKQNCKANIAIYFTTEPQKLLDDVAAHFDLLLGFHYPHQTKKLATFSRPIQVWYVTGSHGYKGADAIDSIWGQPAQASVPSRLTTGGLSSVVMFSLIIIDTKAVVGQEVDAISDYIAMIALTQVQSLDACGALPTIIDLLSADCGSRPRPDRITAGDVAYLRALYSLDMEQPLEIQKMDLQIKMQRELASKSP